MSPYLFHQINRVSYKAQRHYPRGRLRTSGASDGGSTLTLHIVRRNFPRNDEVHSAFSFYLDNRIFTRLFQLGFPVFSRFKVVRTPCVAVPCSV